MEIKFADLFCGLGAYHKAFNRCLDVKSYKCVFACDIDENIRNIYMENYGIMPHGDIRNVKLSEIPDFDILCAGFPCQPFSIAGKKDGFANKKHGNLFYNILNIIDAKQPQTLLLENVKNIKTIDKGSVMNIIISELENRGYHVSYEILDSKYYNCPQSRKRIYFVCSKKKKYQFKLIKNPIVPVSSIIDFSIEEYFNYVDKYRLELVNNKKSMVKYNLVNKSTGKGGRQGERVYSIESYGPTICATSGGPGAKTGLYEINKQIRTLTNKECLKMFGFGEDFKYTKLKNKKKLLFYLGNSIVVNVLSQIIKDLDL